MTEQKQAPGPRTTAAQARWALRHPGAYAGRFGFGLFQIVFLPVISVSSLLATFFIGRIQ
ncbi:hypothetical protein ACH4ZX_12555 [Streptomyces sp. NPDC020490]|uniref:hypothetical protein n=1 Tax=Streptomyces sp. NPDC020490 TaxID=3365078 RepID=UPI00379DC132